MSTRKQLSSSLQSADWLWAFFYLLSILSFLLTPAATALVPISVHGYAYATIKEDLFIIQGGADWQNASVNIPVNQFMALNLTHSSWDTTNPPWVPMELISPLPANLTTYDHSMTVSIDQRTITFWDSASSGSATNYSLIEHSPKPIYMAPDLQRSDKQLKAEVDPNSGWIYIPLGYDKTNMLAYDPLSPTSGAETGSKAPQIAAGPGAASPLGIGRARQIVMPDTVKRGATGYSWVWSSNRSSFILFGGRIGEGAADVPYLHEFKPTYGPSGPGGTWTVLVSSVLGKP